MTAADYVCPQCGPDPRGGDAHAEDKHTWHGRAEPRTWLYGLTADEWLHLASDGQDSEVGPCCGDISGLRETLVTLAGAQAAMAWLLAPDVLGAYEVALRGHDTLASAETFPLLHRVLTGVRAERP